MSAYADLIEQLRNFPQQLIELTSQLSEYDLTTAFLANEWTVAQNVHHLVDSHTNCYIRCKLVLAEDRPTFRTYDQDVWATHLDAVSADLSASYAALQGLHQRWANFFANLTPEQWERKGIHPENGEISLAELLQAYVNHGEGHLDQIQRTLAAKA
jgi:hypothetical protein